MYNKSIKFRETGRLQAGFGFSSSAFDTLVKNGQLVYFKITTTGLKGQ